jgi:hypothetical protein
MAPKKTKKQKRDNKKKLANKASLTRQHKQNIENKQHIENEYQRFIEKPSTLSFLNPPKFYIGCENETLGQAECQFMMSDSTYAEGIEVGIYPATESFNHFITQRMLAEQHEVPSLNDVNWIVVKLKSMFYIDSFVELTDAKNCVTSNFPEVKVFRLDSLGTKDLPFGELEFAPMPDFKTATKEEWVQFGLQCQDDLGYRFDADDAIELLLQVLVDEHNANPNIVDEFCNHGSVASGLEHASMHSLSGAEIGINTLQEFDEKYCRLR